MQKIPLYPLLFQPVYKDYIWGGSRVAQRYKRSLPPGIYAESWEIADRPEGMSIVINGALAGQDLFSLMKVYGDQITGVSQGEFPLLVKIIDAKETLSVQVHPDEAGVKETGGDPKTEMWYVLAAEPGSVIYAGLKAGVDAAVFKEALKKGNVGDLLPAIPVAKGDVIYIPGGRVHAIGPGCMLLEVLQNSDTTFRLHDWNRLGKDGNPRALQINKALRVIRWNDTESPIVAASRRPVRLDADGNAAVELLNTRFFKFEKIVAAKPMRCLTGGKTFHVLFVDEGSVELAAAPTRVRISMGSTVLIPAALPEYTLTPSAGVAAILRVSLP